MTQRQFRCLLAGLLALMFTAPGFGIAALQGAESDESPSFVHARGRQLIQNGSPITLRAICFSNYYNYSSAEFDLLHSNHHAEQDFQRVKTLGFNSIRFGFNGNWYRDNPVDFWAWLDRNVAWARQYEVMLILDLHRPIGGFWLDPTSPQLDFSLWNDPALQQQNIELWQAIARRYRDEPSVAAYDILNEPVTTDSTGKQWRDLAERLVKAIRAVDDKHLIIVERLYGVNQQYGTKDIPPLFLVDDDNVMYDFHFYQPLEYTHQYASWVARPIGDGGHYPNPAVLLPTGQQRLVPEQRIYSASLAAGDTPWRRYESDQATVTDPQVLAALPILVLRGDVRGTVQFDDLKVLEFAPDGGYLGEVFHEPFSRQTLGQWWGWETQSAEPLKTAQLTRVENAGSNDDYSLAITRAKNRGIAGWSSEQRWFKVKTGHRYQIVGYMRGEGISYGNRDKNTRAGYELDFYAAPLNGDAKPFLNRDKAYLERELMKSLQFGLEHQVPMSVLEFGLVRACFEIRGKGGSRWLEDMLDLLHEHQLSFAYWNYHGDNMGVYLTDQKNPPGEPNLPLMKTLREQLADWTQ